MEFSGLTLKDFLADDLQDFAQTSHQITDNTQSQDKDEDSVFLNVDESEIRRLQQKNSCKNTVRSTDTWIRRFECWRKTRKITNALEDIPPHELDSVLQRFYAELRKKDGSEYEPDSLRTMLAALDRHLKECGKLYSLIQDREFKGSREVLNGKAIELRQQGKGKKPQRADALTVEEEELLWEKKALGQHSPCTLNHTIFCHLSQHFGTRGRQEHHSIRLEELRFIKDPQTGKTDYIEWVEGPTKTRHGGLNKPSRRLPQRVFAVPGGGARCPVAAIELMASKRPENFRDSGPLYLKPLSTPKKDTWYAAQPVGVHTIDRYMKQITAKAGLDNTGKKFTNHAARKTVVRKLKRSGVEGRDIIAITGHKSEESLKDYEEHTLEDHRNFSSIIAGQKPSSDNSTQLGCSMNAAGSSYTNETGMDMINYGYPYPYYPPPPYYYSTHSAHCTSYPFDHYTPPPVQLPQTKQQYHMHGCTVYFTDSSHGKRKRRRAQIIDSDEDSP